MNSICQRIRLFTNSNQRLFKQLFLYALTGCAQLLADWLCFMFLTWLAIDVIPANVIGRVVGATLGFWLNGQYTFARDITASAPQRRQLPRFIIGWIVTAVLSTTFVWILDAFGGIRAARLGKPVVDATLAVLGFALSKYWIFR